MTRREEIILVMIWLGGQATLKEITQGVISITTNPIPLRLDAGIRKEIETHSSDSANFNGKDDIFYSVCGLGNGVWGLRDFS